MSKNIARDYWLKAIISAWEKAVSFHLSCTCDLLPPHDIVTMCSFVTTIMSSDTIVVQRVSLAQLFSSRPAPPLSQFHSLPPWWSHKLISFPFNYLCAHAPVQVEVPLASRRGCWVSWSSHYKGLWNAWCWCWGPLQHQYHLATGPSLQPPQLVLQLNRDKVGTK